MTIQDTLKHNETASPSLISNDALFDAMIKNDAGALKTQLSAGADPNCANEGGWTLLALAVMHNNIDMVNALAETGADMNARSATGHTPLMLCVLSNNIDMAFGLISAGAKIDMQSAEWRDIRVLIDDCKPDNFEQAIFAYIAQKAMQDAIHGRPVNIAAESEQVKEEDQDENAPTAITKTNHLVIESNIAVIAHVLTRYGATHVVVSFDGSGDSGCIEDRELHFSDTMHDVDKIKDQIYYVGIDKQYSMYENGFKIKNAFSQKNVNLDEALESVLWMAVTDVGHDGWENNDGGGGRLTIHADGQAELAVYINADIESYDADKSSGKDDNDDYEPEMEKQYEHHDFSALKIDAPIPRLPRP